MDDKQATSTIKNSLFILFFLSAVFIVLAFALKSATGKNDVFENLSYFMKQSNTGSLILYIVALNFLLTYFPQTLFTRFYSFFMILIVALTSFMFFRTMNNSKYISKYYEYPDKLVLFICALTLFVMLWIYKPGILFDSTYGSVSLIFAFLFSIFAFLFFIIYLTVPSNSSDLFKKSLAILFGFLTSAMFIGWLTWMIVQYSHNKSIGSGGILSILLSMAIIILFGILFIKTYQTQFLYKNREKNAFFEFLLNSILYIPCFMTSLFDKINKSVFSSSSSSSASTSDSSAFSSAYFANQFKTSAAYTANNIKNTQKEIWFVLFAIVGCIVAYYYIPSIKKNIYLNGFLQLINTPTSLSSSSMVGNYKQLQEQGQQQTMSDSGTDSSTYKPDYRYGISLWFFIDALSPNTNKSYTQYSPIFNYGYKPLIEYNAEKNSLRIQIGDDRDENKRKIVFEQSNIALQKWINLVVNYDGGTVDVFMDGTLLKSVPGIVPYMRMDSIVIGSENGLHGKVCNVIYANKPMSLANIYYMRYLVKDSNPPVLDMNAFVPK